MPTSPVIICFGDVKLSGCITAKTDIGDKLALIKIYPIPAHLVENSCHLKLDKAVEHPCIYNAMHIAEDGFCSFFLLPDDLEVSFYLDCKSFGFIGC